MLLKKHLTKESDMSKFKVGDKVMLINVDRYTYYVDDIPKRLLGRPLVINSIGTDKNGNEIVYAGVPEGVCCWQWYSDDLRLVSDEEPTSKLQTVNSGEVVSTKVPAAAHSKQFKVGDCVILIDGPDKSDEVHVVTGSYNPSYPLRAGSWTYTADGRLLSSGSVCMRHATGDEIDAVKKPNLPRRGDLVKCRDLLWIVYSEGEDSDGEYRLASLTGDPRVSFVTLDELSWAGSVRKKIKRVKKEMKSES